MCNFLCCASSFSKELIIFHAGSLAKPLKEIGVEFNKKHSDMEIIREASGSREAAFKIVHLNRNCDLIFSADYKVIEEILFPQYSSWYLIFAKDKMVVIFSEWSRYSSEINEKNWQEVLTREAVRVGRSDENLDPCGYRTLMVWQLAEKFYKKEGLSAKLAKNCPRENIRPKAIELVSQIECLDLDYIFNYLSIAVQHHLQYIELPEEINLGHFKYDDNYKNAKIKVRGLKGESIVEGSAIQFALSIPDNAPHRKEAIEFLKFLISKEAQNIIEENGQPVYFFLKGKISQDLKFLEEFRK